VDDIKIYRKETERENMDWIDLAQGVVQWWDSCEHGDISLCSIKAGQFFN
jgi:hypothetical protein